MKVSGAEKSHNSSEQAPADWRAIISRHTMTGTGTKRAQLNKINIHNRIIFSVRLKSRKKVEKKRMELVFTLYNVNKYILHSVDVFNEIGQYPRVLFKEQSWLNTPPKEPVFRPSPPIA
jgi:hypothetical protein